MMNNLCIDDVENFIISFLLFKLLNEPGGYINDLDDCFIINSASFDFQVTHLFIAIIFGQDRFKYHFIQVSFHDTIQRKVIIYLPRNIKILCCRREVYMLEQDEIQKIIFCLS